jgi:hypothetical protein
VTRRRLIPLALLVTALLAVVAIAARGHPLGKDSSGNGGTGLPRTFWDYLFSTFVVLELVLIVFTLVAVFFFRRERAVVARYNPRTLRALAVLILVSALISYVARHVNLQHLHLARAPKPPRRSALTSGHDTNPTSPIQHVHFQWEVLVIVLVLLLALGVSAWVARSRLGPATRRRRPAPEALAAALDESLDDLRSDPDLRRAIIAAYARMEAALAAAGIPRDPAEAPLEYVERALLTLDASASAVRRLTDLFEWARFSHHEPEPSMRDEAIDALVAVRDELRAAELTPA